MAIVESSNVRLKVTDDEGDSLIVHDPEPNGAILITCHSRDLDDYATVEISNDERLALIARLQGLGPRCPACVDHPGWSCGEETGRRASKDCCRACLGSGRVQPTF